MELNTTVHNKDQTKHFMLSEKNIPSQICTKNMWSELGDGGIKTRPKITIETVLK